MSLIIKIYVCSEQNTYMYYWGIDTVTQIHGGRGNSMQAFSPTIIAIGYPQITYTQTSMYT